MPLHSSRSHCFANVLIIGCVDSGVSTKVARRSTSLASVCSVSRRTRARLLWARRWRCWRRRVSICIMLGSLRTCEGASAICIGEKRSGWCRCGGREDGREVDSTNLVLRVGLIVLTEKRVGKGIYRSCIVVISTVYVPVLAMSSALLAVRAMRKRALYAEQRRKAPYGKQSI